ncbi:MAG: hypothetical protein IJC24_07265 [Clostridia bacterium]|nr:hypothetical protein [Clostridia bacterium]
MDIMDLSKLAEMPDFPLEEPYYKENDVWTSKFNFDFEDKSKRKDFVTIHDVTLRDGDQTPGVVMLEDERVRIGDALAKMRVPRIEAGMPIVGKRVENAMRRMVAKKYEYSKIYAFCRAHPADIDLALDIGCQGAIVEYTTNPYIIKYAYKKSPSEVLQMLVTAVNKAKEGGLDVAFMGWDWFRTPLEYTRWLVDGLNNKTDIDGIVLVDTYGSATPEAVEEMFCRFHDWYPNLRLEFHGHNDIGCGNANCLAAVRGGADVVHTAVHGLGERCGNVATEEMAVIFEKHKKVSTGMDLTQLYPTGKLVSTISKVPIHDNKPVLGNRPYQAESGVGMDIAYKLSHNDRFQISNMNITVEPSLIGRTDDVEYVLGKSSGKNSIRLFLDKYNIEADEDQVKEILDMVQEEALVTKALVPEDTFLQFVNTVLNRK